MSMMFDTCAWFEYFIGSAQGKVVKRVVDSSETIYTSALTLLDFKSKYLRHNTPYHSQLQFIRERSQIVPLDEPIALVAADFAGTKKLHASDAVIYATALEKGCTLLTSDTHFSCLDGVRML